MISMDPIKDYLHRNPESQKLHHKREIFFSTRQIEAKHMQSNCIQSTNKLQKTF